MNDTHLLQEPKPAVTNDIGGSNSVPCMANKQIVIDSKDDTVRRVKLSQSTSELLGVDHIEVRKSEVNNRQ